MTTLLTTKQAAEYLGVSMARIRQLIGGAQVRAQRNGKSWLVEQDSLDEYAATATPGRPVGSTSRNRESRVAAPTRYTLMNRDHEVARCVYDLREHCFTQVRILDRDRVPLALCGYEATNNLRGALNDWWGSRGIPSSRWNFEQRLNELKVQHAFDLPLRSLGLSLSDQYWMRPDGSSLSWRNVTFFLNRFEFGVDNNDPSGMSHTSPWLNAVGLNSPDNTTDGMLNKRWLLDGEGQRVLIKGNGSSGREVYNEIIATKLYRRLMPNWRYVEYTLRSWRDEDVCACATFLRDDEEFIPAWYVLKMRKKRNEHNLLRHYCEICEDLGVRGAENQVSRMVVCDSILANTDRHWGNFGIIRNVETLEYRVAPLFDTGNSLWTNVPLRALANGNYSFSAKPFNKDPQKQLDLVVDASWYHPEALNGFVDEVRVFMDAALGGSDRNEAIYRGLKQRIEAVNHWAESAPVKPSSLAKDENTENLEWVWL